MLTSWILLFIGGLCEVGFVTMMKLSNGFKNLKYSILTFAFMIASFYSLSIALKDITIGTGYAIWAGVGAVGSVLVGIYYFKDTKNNFKLFFILMIIVGIIGLKLTGS